MEQVMEITLMELVMVIVRILNIHLLRELVMVIVQMKCGLLYKVIDEDIC